MWLLEHFKLHVQLKVCFYWPPSLDLHGKKCLACVYIMRVKRLRFNADSTQGVKGNPLEMMVTFSKMRITGDWGSTLGGMENGVCLYKLEMSNGP